MLLPLPELAGLQQCVTNLTDCLVETPIDNCSSCYGLVPISCPPLEAEGICMELSVSFNYQKQKNPKTTVRNPKKQELQM